MATKRKKYATESARPPRDARPSRAPGTTFKVNAAPAVPWIPISAAVAVVLIFVIVLILVKLWTPPPSGPVASTSQTPAILTTLSTIPASSYEMVGAGAIQTSSYPTPVKSAPVLAGTSGKPEFFYEGAEYCPYCAAERWPMIVALSRFGTLSGLEETTSASDDVFPNTPTFSFQKATFTSQYLEFVPVEIQDRSRNPLQTPTAAENALTTKYNPQGSIPFLDFGNVYTISGATYPPDVIQNQSWQKIALAVSTGTGPDAQAILGAANVMTATICKMTGDQPSSVCDPAIQAIESKLG
ncbi:MAG TPA: DUF929 family protein [Candidatus Dormibacteraeota bacterium]|jgi:hypothetical protein|nr:DUF929 family protein [Candidatus Dormibacteraeota bacterium]